MALSCVSTEANIGASACKKLPQAVKGFIKTPLAFTITAANAAVLANWQDAILAASGVRVHFFPEAYEFENVSEDTVRATSNLGKEVFVRPGQYRFRVQFRENLELHKAMRTHLESAGRIFLIDIQGKLIGTSSDDGVTLKGFTLDQFAPEKMQFGDGSTPSTSPVYFTLRDSDELDLNGQQIEFGTIYSNLKALTTVDLTIIGTPSSTEIQVKVASALDQVVLLGLVTADFTVSTGSVSGVTDANGDGTYVIAGTGFTSGTVNLVAASALTVEAFESSGAVAFTVSS